jgi:predicted MPP superfamily phosphohydrolase
MNGLLLKRKSIEIQGLEHWLTHDPRRLLFRHENILRPLLKHGLRLTGLLGRGERNALRTVIRKMHLAFDNLPRAFCGFRILQLSDLHIDGIPGLAERVAGQIAPLEVDLCVLTGDYRFATSGPCHNVYPGMRTIIRAIRSRQGILGILGNHDYAEEIPELEAMGVRMLMNRAVEIVNPRGSVWIVGVDDAWDYDCADLPGALSSVPDGAFKIVLAHSPDIIAEAALAGVHLYLCGHTHAGQIRLPLIGPVLAPATCDRRFWQGRWKQGDMEGYTSSGIGCSLLPVRFRCPPEIGLIELRCSRHSMGEGCCARAADGLRESGGQEKNPAIKKDGCEALTSR